MKENTLTNSEIANFTNQLALILHAGISPVEGVAIMKEDCEDQSFIKVLESISDDLNVGMTLFESFSRTQVFPHYLLEMVHLGEASGRLEDVMSALSKHYERLHDNSENLKSALTYPFIMIIMMLIVVIVLITQVLPIFNQVFEQLGSSITGFSKTVMDFGSILSSYSYIFIGIVILIIALYFYFSRNETGKTQFYDFLSKAKFSRDISMNLALSQFTSGMALGMSSGLDIEQSLDMASELVENKILKDEITQCKEIMKEKDIASGLVESHILTGMYARLIKLGYKTGGMDAIMSDIADKYDRETNEKITHLISIVEPTIVAILSVLVGLILLSVMMPLIGIMSTL